MEKLGSRLMDGRSLRFRVFSEIERAILDGELAPGDALIEQKLSDELGVSRTPVREALRQLELDGLVRTVPNKGAVVVGVSPKDIDDIYAIRMHIEGLAARWAAENITPEELLAMRELVDLQEFYVARSDTEQVWSLDGRFHGMIYDASRSRPLHHTLSSFHHHIQKARELSFKTVGRASLAVTEHRRILEALEAGNAAEAERLAAEHVLNAKNNVLGHLQAHD